MANFKSIEHIKEDFRCRRVLIDHWLETGKPFWITKSEIPLSKESYNTMIAELDKSMAKAIEEFEEEHEEV